MSQISKSSKKAKRKPKKADIEEEEELNDEPAEDLAAPRGIVEVGADDWMEEEFGAAKAKKGKKGKKGGNKKQPVESEDEAIAEVTQAVDEVKIAEPKPAPAAAAAPKEEAGDEEPTGVLSKKEKERLKKEKEKVRVGPSSLGDESSFEMIANHDLRCQAKKKAQAAAKKAASGGAPVEATPAAATEPSPSAPIAEAAGEDDEGEEGGDAAGKKNKKKKKKAADKKEPAPAPAKKPNAKIAALQVRFYARARWNPPLTLNLHIGSHGSSEEGAGGGRGRGSRRAQVSADHLALDRAIADFPALTRRIADEEKRLEEEENAKAEEKARKKEKERVRALSHRLGAVVGLTRHFPLLTNPLFITGQEGAAQEGGQASYPQAKGREGCRRSSSRRSRRRRRTSGRRSAEGRR